MTRDRLLARALDRIGECGRLMVGVPNYAAYLEHMRATHADATPMSEAEFVRNRQSARFGEGGRGGFRCC
ncbi:CstA-like transporter-associated (seleno)protein [Sphingomonas floccifaciens]|uniref:CstA-like transporter-associated (Seleno)protein n=1 Tax=Sphingomonas floccifaciens TaxID=1844115 RepID=A0ABW4N821_9SPHN